MPVPTMPMTTPDGTVWQFDAGALSLEFLLTGGPDAIAVFDSLHAPADLGAWAMRSRLGVPDGALHTSAHELRQARRLRDALWRLTWARIRGDTAAAADLEQLNHAAAHPPLVSQLTPDGHRRWQLPASGAALASTVARDAIDVLATAAAGRLRECEAADCRLVFLDTSRPGSRRWCSMERCGNRHKVRALRSRRSTPPSSPAREGERS